MRGPQYMAALAWAQTYGPSPITGKYPTIYCLLPRGARFAFPSAPSRILLKTGGGWYRDVGTGRAMRTGARTAVYAMDLGAGHGALS